MRRRIGRLRRGSRRRGRTAGCRRSAAARSSRCRAARSAWRCRACRAGSPCDRLRATAPTRGSSTGPSRSRCVRSFDGRAVVAAADAFGELVVQAVGHVARAGEHHVLEEVREARCGPTHSFFEPTWYQTFTATVGVAWSCERIDGQPVRQRVGLERNVDRRRRFFVRPVRPLSQWSREPRRRVVVSLGAFLLQRPLNLVLDPAWRLRGL